MWWLTTSVENNGYRQPRRSDSAWKLEHVIKLRRWYVEMRTGAWNLLLLLLLLALQPTMGFSLLSDFLPFRPFLAQFPPSSYSHRLESHFLVLFLVSYVGSVP